MNTKGLFVSIWLSVVLFVNTAGAQNTYEIGLLPALNLNKKLKKNWSVNFKAESRTLIQKGDFTGYQEQKMDYILSDLSVMMAKKTGLNNRIAGGYLMRLSENGVIHRAIQQFTVVNNYSNYRLAHRFTSDQTFSNTAPTIYRLRYRLSAEIPLNGQTVDQKEFYIKINTELLNAIQSNVYDLEIRFLPILGYNFTDQNKLELGIDYRINNFINNASEQNFWLNLNWFIEI